MSLGCFVPYLLSHTRQRRQELIAERRFKLDHYRLFVMLWPILYLFHRITLIINTSQEYTAQIESKLACGAAILLDSEVFVQYTKRPELVAFVEEAFPKVTEKVYAAPTYQPAAISFPNKKGGDRKSVV